MMAFGSGLYRRGAWEILHEELGISWSEDFRGAMFVPEEYRYARTTKESVKCVLGWSHFIGLTCSISIFLREPQYLTKQIVREAFRFPFMECRMNAVLAQAAASNAPSLELIRRVGFREVHKVKRGAPDESDLLLFEMHRDDCRWIKGAQK